MTTFERIKEISKKRGLSLRKVSENAGLSENVIYSWKKKTPSTQSLEKVANALDVKVSQIIDTKSEITKSTKSVDLDDMSTLMMFEGRPIPEEDKETVKAVLRSLRQRREEMDRKNHDK